MRTVSGFEIVCICGSTRFRDEIAEANRRLTLEGAIVLAPGVFAHGGDLLTDEDKERLDIQHLAKIDLSEWVYVVNPGGYIGQSTFNEIQYAERTGKRVEYLIDPDDHQAWLRSMTDPQTPEDYARAHEGAERLRAAMHEQALRQGDDYIRGATDGGGER